MNRVKRYQLRWAIITITFFLLTGCQSITQDGPPLLPRSVDHIPDAIPKKEPLAQRGNPDSYEVFGKRYYTQKSSSGYKKRGLASWYGTKFHGKSTSSGEPYDIYAMTAAHKTLPLPTYAKVTNLDNGKSVIVKINDRGPFHSDRLIDLSYAAARKLGIYGKGTGHVEVEAIHADSPTMNIPSAPKRSLAQTTKPLYLQVGIFTEQKNAHDLAKKLKAYGTTSIQSHQVQQKAHFRVLLGPLKSKSEATALKQDLAEKWKLSALIITEG